MSKTKSFFGHHNNHEMSSKISIVPEGKILRNAIRGKGITILEAAEALDMSRTNLQYYLTKDEFDNDFRQKVKEKLNIDIDSIISGVIKQNNDFAKLPFAEQALRALKLAHEIEKLTAQLDWYTASADSLNKIQSTTREKRDLEAKNSTLDSLKGRIVKRKESLLHILNWTKEDINHIDVQNVYEYLLNRNSSTGHAQQGESTSDSHALEYLKIRIEEQERESQKLSAENLDWQKRYIEANKDFLQATKETLELSAKNKTMARAIKTFYETLQEMKFNNEDDKAQVMKLYEDIVISSLHQK